MPNSCETKVSLFTPLVCFSTISPSALAVSAAQAAPQWPPFVPKDVPQTSAGKPNLAAPAPQTADGKPDFSGSWENAPTAGGGRRRGIALQAMDQRAARQAARRRGYVGRYQMGPGTITITKQNGQLMRKLSELPPFEMYPTRRDFYITNFDARFTFDVDAQGKPTAIVMHTDTDVRAPRPK